LKTYLSHSANETRAYGADFVKMLGSHAVIRLSGDLGAGKTCWVQGMAEGLGWTDAVTSPTYGLVQEFQTQPPLIHADLYRLTESKQIWDLGLDEWMDDEALVAVEWSERVPDFWPADAWHVQLNPIPGNEQQREICIWQGATHV
jgi:tRNA threonylcarbamoyladenosine biosynthesis protein TsaE